MRQGATLPLFAVTLPAILILGAFAINLAWISLVRTELRAASDASARAAGRTFSETQDVGLAEARAIEAAAQNTVAGRPLVLASDQINFGESAVQASGPTAGRFLFTEKDTSGPVGAGPGETFINSVQVFAKGHDENGDFEVPLIVPFTLTSTGFRPQFESVSTQSDRDVVLVLDRSGSMNAPSVDDGSWSAAGPGEAYNGSKWRELVDAVEVFLVTLDGTPLSEQVGLVTFSTDSRIDEQMNLDYSTVRNEMDSITNNFRGGYTAIGRGIIDGVQVLTDTSTARAFATKTMIVMTDGIHNTGVHPVAEAQIAQDTYGITVHTITFSSGADQTTMQAVANAGDGNHWHADNGTQLQLVFEEIARTLPTMLTK